jgi:hypothetical protein
MHATQRLPLHAGNCPAYNPEPGISPTREVLFDELVPLSAPCECQTCGRIIAHGQLARSRAEIFDEQQQVNFKWCLECVGAWADIWRDSEDVGFHLRAVLAAVSEGKEALSSTEPAAGFIPRSIEAARAIKKAMDDHPIAFASDGTLKGRCDRLVKALQKQITASVEPGAESQAVATVHDFLRTEGIVTPTGDGCDVHISKLATLLGIKEETALVIVKHPGALEDVVAGFLKLKRAA